MTASLSDASRIECCFRDALERSPYPYFHKSRHPSLPNITSPLPCGHLRASSGAKIGSGHCKPVKVPRGGNKSSTRPHCQIIPWACVSDLRAWLTDLTCRENEDVSALEAGGSPRPRGSPAAPRRMSRPAESLCSAAASCPPV